MSSYSREKLKSTIVRGMGGLLALALVTVCLGCGPGRGAPTGAATTSPGPEDASAVSSASTTGTERSVAAAFREAAASVAPMAVYGWFSLPEGIRLADEWWPVLEAASREEYSGSTAKNPQVTGVGTADPQVQVVFRASDGWVLVVENFRGDLGDVQGEFVGEVDGHAATLYDAAGGRLVQWSDGGRWYGVFGRGLTDDELVGLALEATVIRPVDSENGD